MRRMATLAIVAILLIGCTSSAVSPTRSPDGSPTAFTTASSPSVGLSPTGTGGQESTGWKVYRSLPAGFELRSPPEWTATTTRGCGVGAILDGVQLTNVASADIPGEPPTTCRKVWPPPRLLQFDPAGVVLRFELRRGYTTGFFRDENTPLPLQLSDFEPTDHGSGRFLAVTLHRIGSYVGTVWVGPDAPSADIDALEQAVESIRPWAPPRPDLHIGQCADGWMGMTPPAGHGILALRPHAVSVSSPTDAWAVGSYDRVVLAKGKHPPSKTEVPLALRWDGTAWSLVPLEAGERIDDIVAIAPDDAWAVGGGGNGSPIEHWDGDRWRSVPRPALRFDSGEGKFVAATGADDVWVAGTAAEQGRRIAVLHWDGESWIRSPFPDLDRSTAAGVAAGSPNVVWVIGSRANRHRPVVFRWGGSAWRSTDTRALRLSSLDGVVALGPADAWAVGSTRRREGGDSFAEALVAHWDGSAWRPVSTPPLPKDTFLYDVSASGPSDVWALGWANEPEAAILLHFDGRAWTRVEPPIHEYGFLTDVSAVPGTGTWIVGTDGSFTPYRSDLAVLARSC